MAVTSVTRLPRGRASTRGLKGERTYTKQYQVITDDKDDGPLTVRTADGIDEIYATYVDGHDSDSGCRCSSKEVRQSGDDPLVWEVVCQFSVLKQDEHVHPLEREPEVSFAFEHFETIAEKDVFGGGVLNSAGQYFDPPIGKDDSRPVLTIKRNEASFVGSLAIQYQDAVNSDAFAGAVAQQCKIFNISATRHVEPWGEPPEDVVYWSVTYEIHFARDGWRKQLLDQGRYELGSGGKLQAIEDTEDRPVADPVLLDGAGHKLGGGNPVYLEYQVYRELPFAALDLPV